MNKSKVTLLLSSDVGMMFALVNVFGLLWYCVFKNHPVPSGMVPIVMSIWTGKTVHSVLGGSKNAVKK